MLKRLPLAFAFVVIALPCVAVFAQKSATPRYIGASACVACHRKMDDAVDIWKKEKHAKSLGTLDSAAAKKIQAGAKTSPQCLECHVTGYGKPGGFSLKMPESDRADQYLDCVSCEECHGPGEKYTKTMMKVKTKSVAYSEGMFKADGLVSKPDKSTCETCHNKKSPTFKSFDFKKYFEQIKHGKKTAQK